MRGYIAAVGAQTAYFEPGRPWQHGYCESYNFRLRGAGITTASGPISPWATAVGS